MRIIAIILSALLLITTSALALEKIFVDTSPRVANVLNMTETRYFANRRIVSQMRGVVSAGRVESDFLGVFSIQNIRGRDTICLTVNGECFAVAPSLSKDSILRIAHWAVQGNFKVFSCLITTSLEARELMNEGFVNAGPSGAQCGNRFVHPTLNSPELVGIFSYIDFGNSFAPSFDEKDPNCQIDYRVLSRAINALEAVQRTVSYVNMDVGTVYRVRTSLNNSVPVLSFSGSPTRNNWILPVNEAAIVFARCNARPATTRDQRRAVAFFHVAALFREAAMRDNRSVIEFINAHTASLP